MWRKAVGVIAKEALNAILVQSGYARLCSELYSAATTNGLLPLVVRAVGISTTSVSKSSFGALIIG